MKKYSILGILVASLCLGCQSSISITRVNDTVGGQRAVFTGTYKFPAWNKKYLSGLNMNLDTNGIFSIDIKSLSSDSATGLRDMLRATAEGAAAGAAKGIKPAL